MRFSLLGGFSSPSFPYSRHDKGYCLHLMRGVHEGEKILVKFLILISSHIGADGESVRRVGMLCAHKVVGHHMDAVVTLTEQVGLTVASIHDTHTLCVGVGFRLAPLAGFVGSGAIAAFAFLVLFNLKLALNAILTGGPVVEFGLESGIAERKHDF